MEISEELAEKIIKIIDYNDKRMSLLCFIDILICFSAKGEKSEICAENLSKFMDKFHIREGIDTSIFFIHHNVLRVHSLDSGGWVDWESRLYPGYSHYPLSASIVISRFKILITGGID